MKHLLYIAISRLLKRKVPNLLIVILITTSITVINIVTGLFNDFESRITSKILIFTPHISINDNLNKEAFKSEKDIKQIIKIAQIQGLLVDPDSRLTKGITIKAVDEANISNFLDDTSIIGKFPKKEEILLGKKILTSLNIQLGQDIFFITGPTKTNKFKVVGIINSGVHEYDSNLGIAASQSFTNELLNANSNTGIWLINPANAKLFSYKLNQLGIKNISNWQDENRSIFKAIEIEKLVMYTTLSLLVILTGVAITAIQIVNVIGQKRHIGVLAAIGLTNRNLFAIFTIEPGILALAGIFLGNLITLAFDYFASNHLNLHNIGIYELNNLHLNLNAANLIVNSSVILLFCLITSSIPALLILKSGISRILKD